jgi:hypothetical protein
MIANLVSGLLVLSVLGVAGAAAKTSKIKPPKGAAIEIVAHSGSVVLLNQKKIPTEISDFSKVRVEMFGPGILKLWRALAGDRRLVIYNGTDEFSFLITRKSFNTQSEFSTHQQYTGQNYHIQMKREIKDFKSLVSEKIITCTWETSSPSFRMVTDSDGNSTMETYWETTTHYGKQKARVDDQTWSERENYIIYNESSQTRFRTYFVPRENQNVLERLTSCSYSNS